MFSTPVYARDLSEPDKLRGIQGALRWETGANFVPHFLLRRLEHRTDRSVCKPASRQLLCVRGPHRATVEFTIDFRFDLPTARIQETAAAGSGEPETPDPLMPVVISIVDQARLITSGWGARPNN